MDFAVNAAKRMFENFKRSMAAFFIARQKKARMGQ